ncbi:endoglucanase [Salix suchowensis]|nr:endoglucanase [Salix suchowensis]
MGNRTRLSKHSKALYRISDLSVLSWDNKLPAAMLLLTRYRIFLNPGYPYEEMLHMYHNKTELNMCFISDSSMYSTGLKVQASGGLIRLNSGRPRPLQYVANTAFLASLFVDYLNATRVPGFQCGSKFISLDVLRSFATSINYILGDNPMKMSYVGGMAPSSPDIFITWCINSMTREGIHAQEDGSGRDSPRPNPNNITGAGWRA